MCIELKELVKKEKEVGDGLEKTLMPLIDPLDKVIDKAMEYKGCFPKKEVSEFYLPGENPKYILV